MADLILTEAAEAAARAGEREKRRRERFLEDLRAAFGTDQGRRVLEWIFAACRVNGSVLARGERMAYLAGAQDFGNDLRDLVKEADVDILVDLLCREADKAKGGEE